LAGAVIRLTSRCRAWRPATPCPGPTAPFSSSLETTREIYASVAFAQGARRRLLYWL